MPPYITKAKVLYGTLAATLLLLLFPPYTTGNLGFILAPPSRNVWREYGGFMGNGGYVSVNADLDLVRLFMLLAVVGLVGGVLYWKAPRSE